MPAFPSWVQIVPRDAGELLASVVVRSDMERGVAKQRRIAADAIATIAITAIFTSAQRAEDFVDWFYDDIAAGAATFDFVHPRTGATVQGRIVGGDIGELRPLGTVAGSRWSRSFSIEYVRSTL